MYIYISCFNIGGDIMINKFYQALKEKDISTLKLIVHPDMFGIRLYNEETYYTRNDFLKSVSLLDYEGVEIVNQSIDNHFHIDLINGDNKIKSKIVMKDSLIYKVYETVTSGARRMKCIISYDGSTYLGYQRQKDENTIQGSIEKALKQALKKDVMIHSSGRTDKGVHAFNQVIHFDLQMSIPIYSLKKLLNSYLPDSIYVKEITEEDETFHSRYDVSRKTYCYKINMKEYSPITRNYEWFVSDFDIERYKSALESVIGTHDFASFTKTTKHSTLRTIYSVKVQQTNDIVYTYITGNGFLRYMVRNIVGAAVHIAKGSISLTMEDIINKKDVNILKDKAPATGLYLDRVEYND